MANQNSKETIGWLETIGSSDKGDVVKLNHTAKALIDLGEFIITKARKNMDRNANTATGGTSASMALRDLETNATRMSLDIEIKSTYKFLNDGVKGTEGGTGKYQFRTNRVSRKHATAMLKWLRRRGVVSKYKAYTKHSKNEVKNKTINKMVKSATNYESLAYAVAAAIKKKGIKPTYFFSNAVEDGRKNQEKFLQKAFKLDIIEAL